MKNSELIQRVQSLYSHGVQSSDTRLTDRHIFSALTSVRAILLSQQANKKQLASDWIYQSLPCIELIKAPVHECPCIPNNDCQILRSKFKLPKPITGLDNILIKGVIGLDGGLVFDETSFEDAKYQIGNKYTSNKPRWYIKNGYLYITILKFLKSVTLRGLFEDPLADVSFPSICGDCPECECIDIMDREFPIDGSLIKSLLELTYNELIIMMKQMGEDKSNDTSDDTSPAGNMVHQPQTQPNQE